MPCTTLLVGKNASYDGSTIVARNEDAPSGEFTAKRYNIVKPSDQPRHYRCVISHLEIDLPEEPMRYSSVPNADRRVNAVRKINRCRSVRDRKSVV